MKSHYEFPTITQQKKRAYNITSLLRHGNLNKFELNIKLNEKYIFHTRLIYTNKKFTKEIMNHYHYRALHLSYFPRKKKLFIYKKKEKYSTHALLLKCGHLTQFSFIIRFFM